eukprot:Skav212320  [mRNA]  locus=scaffold3374:132272:133265:- [translate_table: standard]
MERGRSSRAQQLRQQRGSRSWRISMSLMDETGVKQAESFEICGLRRLCLNRVSCNGGQLAFYGYEVKAIEGREVLLASASWPFVMGHSGTVKYDSFVELCCGLGGMSLGAEMAGLRVLSAIDISPFAVERYNMNHSAKAFEAS